jgi:DNA-binding HxlR family transcriptional regulator
MPFQLAGSLADRGDRPVGDRCPIDRAMQLVGNRTSVLLLREVLYGVRRFDALVARTGVSEAVAAQRLRALVEADVLAKQPYREAGQRTRHEYVLTASGRDLAPAVLALAVWGEQHLPAAGHVGVTHAGCGEPVAVVPRCAAGHDVPEDEVLVTGSGR